MNPEIKAIKSLIVYSIICCSRLDICDSATRLILRAENLVERRIDELFDELTEIELFSQLYNFHLGLPAKPFFFRKQP